MTPDYAVFLKRYYIESRYPDDLPQYVRPEEAAEAMTVQKSRRRDERRRPQYHLGANT